MGERVHAIGVLAPEADRPLTAGRLRDQDGSPDTTNRLDYSQKPWIPARHGLPPADSSRRPDR